MYNIYTGMLKMLNEFPATGPVMISYGLYDDYTDLLAKYPVLSVAGTGSSFQKITNLLEWISTHVYHKGDYDNQIAMDAVSLLDYSFDNDAEHGINCGLLSMVLTEILLSIGIKARAVFLLPCSPYDGDNHVVCEAWDDDRKKWILLDPTYGSYFIDRNGAPLSVCEMREGLENREDLSLSPGSNYNGDALDKHEILEYFAKNLFYFFVNQRQGRNTGESPLIVIAPKGFDAKRRMITNIDYRMEMTGDSERMQNWKKETAAKEYISSGLGTLKAGG